MLLADMREEIVLYGRRTADEGLTVGTGGNLSCCDRGCNLMAITPSGLRYDRLKPEDIVVADLEDGGIIDGQRIPSSEFSMHLRVYEARSDIGALIHTHSPYATAVSCLNIDLPAVHYLVAAAGGSRIPCAEYARYGTDELGRNAVESMGSGYLAVLLANHGLLAAGEDLSAAFGLAETIEFVAEIFCRARSMGEPVILSESRMEEVAEALSRYGQKDDKV